MSELKLNERLFAGTSAEAEMEELLDGADVEFEKIGWDHYDNSLEIYGVAADYRLSEAARKVIFNAGFSICYVNHLDKWETHYSADGRPTGWRVSYPYKRNDEDPSIWLKDSPPAGWNRFKVTIKKLCE